MTISDLLDLLNQGGTVGLLVLIVVGSSRGWFVWKHQFEDLEADRNWWREVAINGLEATERSLLLHERTNRQAAQ